MRPTSLLVPLALAASLWSAAPAAAQESTESTPPPTPPQVERVLRAADSFDAKATSLRTRAGTLRSEALEARRDAEELLRRDCTCTPADPEYGFSDTDTPAWWEDPTDVPSAAEEEAADLVELAERFEDRAAGLETAADRMAGHATKLRERAAAMMAEANATKAAKFLARAAFLRQQAQSFRDAADQMRDAAFADDQVDDEVVAKIEALEKKAAAYDRRADRFEAIARKLCS